ncbi:hypothetical protein [uncultured Varibaculum sp.]|uniref:hypothetical protein n=1 Tax=uncultured Varibaculum sp. TaxID=413896 RepID=UPI0028037CFC|nr:hypothetical protein [uncultured Varibaculum sp.]
MSEAVPAMRLTAGAPTSVLISSLARSYWGVLDGPEWRAARSILQALTLAPSSKKEITQFDNAGKVFTTATQLQRISGYCERWTRIALQTLEEMGVIRWTRGMIVSGNPTSSLFTVVKRKLIELIKFARPRSKRIDEERRNRFIARLADILRWRRGKDGAARTPDSVRVPSRGAGGVKTNDLQARSACSRHAEATASPSKSLGGYPACRVSRVRKRLFRSLDEDKREALDLFNASADPVEDKPALSPASIEDFVSNYEELEMLPAMPEAHLDRLPDICPHGGYDPAQCNLCVDATRNQNAMKDWRRRVAQDPAYKRAEEAGAFEVSDEQIIRDRATQIATKQAEAMMFKDRADWMAYVLTTADRLVKEYEVKGEAVLWR